MGANCSDQVGKATKDSKTAEAVDNLTPAQWLKQFMDAQGVNKTEVDGMCAALEEARKGADSVGDMMAAYASKVYPTTGKGDAYKTSVTNITRVFGAIDRVFEKGPKEALEMTVKEYRAGVLNPNKLDNTMDQRSEDMKETEAAKTLTEAEVRMTGITFDVFPKKELGPLLETSTVKQKQPAGCHGLGRRDWAICSKFGHGKQHGFISAALAAWSDHYPLELTVDDIWILVLQGLTTHVEQNAEKLRDRFVRFKGKKTLQVQNNTIKPNNVANDWTGSIDGWVELIERSLVTDAMNVSFSTTTRMAQIVERVCVMDCCKSFFSYRCMTRCGFPQITLRGKKEDWVNLQKYSTRAIKELCLPEFSKMWLPALDSVLNKFVDCWEPKYKADTKFWDAMIKLGRQGGSGGYSWYTGWFNVFFPYLGTGTVNEFCSPYDSKVTYVTEGGWGRPKVPGKSVRGPDCGDFPTGRAVAPLEWDYFGKQIPVDLHAGFFAVQQDPKTRALRPLLNWAVLDKKKQEEPMW